MRIEAHITPKDFVDTVPEQPDLGGTFAHTIRPIEILRLPVYKADVLFKQKRGSERFRPRRGYGRGLRGTRVGECGHIVRGSHRCQCRVKLLTISNTIV